MCSPVGPGSAIQRKIRSVGLTTKMTKLRNGYVMIRMPTIDNVEQQVLDTKPEKKRSYRRSYNNYSVVNVGMTVMRVAWTLLQKKS